MSKISKQKIYTFQTHESRTEFIQKCKKIHEKSHAVYEFRENGDTLEFGVEGGGHAGGYWYCATVTESNGLILSGEIRYSGYEPKQYSTFQKIMSAIGLSILAILFLPLILLAFAAGFFEKLFYAIKYKTKICYTQKQKLKNLMVNILGCEEVKENSYGNKENNS